MYYFNSIKVDDPEINDKIKDIRALYTDLLFNLEQLRKNREQSLAITNLEQSLMWAVKSICINYHESDRP